MKIIPINLIYYDPTFFEIEKSFRNLKEKLNY